MYIPKHFKEERLDETHRIIQAYPFGALVTHGPAGIDATHIPFELDSGAGPHGVLLAHVSRANPVWKDNRDGDDVLVIFGGANAYISPNWYPSKHEFHRQVPTWNYQLVHVHGKLRIRDDEPFLRKILARLTQTHEMHAGETKPWKMADSEQEYIDKLLTAIVGIEIEVERIVGVSKLSQNKEERDRQGVIAALQERSNNDTADAMLAAATQKP